MHRLREAMRDGGMLPPMARLAARSKLTKRTLAASQARRKHALAQPIRTLCCHCLTAIPARFAASTLPTPVNEVAPIVRANISKEAHLMTDQAKIYQKLGTEFARHDSVNHQEVEYVRVDGDIKITTNTIESYFSVFKRGMLGTYQHCSEKHLHRYLAEFDFRHNNRTALGVTDGERATELAKGIVGKRLTYRRPNRKTFRHKALRLLRWRDQLPKPKPRFVKYWRTK